MSERCLDRKTIQEVVPAEPVRPVVVAATVAPALEPIEAADPFLFPPSALQLGPKSEQRRREALWDLFQSECAFLYDHLMVLKNVSAPFRLRHKRIKLSSNGCFLKGLYGSAKEDPSRRLRHVC